MQKYDIENLVAVLSPILAPILQPLLTPIVISAIREGLLSELPRRKPVEDRPRNDFPENGFLRAAQVTKMLGISKTSLWRGVKTGRYPNPVKLGPNTTVWKVLEIRALIESAGHEVKP
ncbi:MAG: AlpA family phage regulatory protein [Candidatus Ozemobacteraceae bacterium]